MEQALELKGVNDVNDVIKTWFCVRCILALCLWLAPFSDLRQALLCGGQSSYIQVQVQHFLGSLTYSLAWFSSHVDPRASCWGDRGVTHWSHVTHLGHMHYPALWV